jgi:hypothetical protein
MPEYAVKFFPGERDTLFYLSISQSEKPETLFLASLEEVVFSFR